MLNKSSGIHLLSFASGSYNFKRAKFRFLKNAFNSNLFETIEVITKKDLIQNHENFWNSNRDFIDKHSKSGFGKYIWKPYIIKNKLEQLDYEDILVYLDIGCYINTETQYARDRFNNYISLAKNCGSLAMQLVDGEFGINDLSEISWNSENYLRYLNLPLNFQLSNQIQAGILFLKKSKETLAFTQEWYRYCLFDNYTFLNPESEQANSTSRYDQSVFSPLYKLYNMKYISDETYFAPSWEIEGKDYPIWAMRNRSGWDPKGNYFKNFYEKLIEFVCQII